MILKVESLADAEAALRQSPEAIILIKEKKRDTRLIIHEGNDTSNNLANALKVSFWHMRARRLKATLVKLKLQDVADKLYSSGLSNSNTVTQWQRPESANQKKEREKEERRKRREEELAELEEDY